MKRFLTLSTVALLAVGASQTFAHEHSGMDMSKASAKKTVSGELVDTGCYLAHGARGEKHIDCATKCINEGMPMGLLTDGGALYLLTINHDNADPYNKLKAEAGKKVSVTGTIMTRNGMKAIEVDDYKAMAVNASK